MEVQWAEVDGIPVVSMEAQGDELPAVGITFAVGMADETLPRAGLTHLVEHLALYPLGQTEYDYNGVVKLHTTSFWAHGDPSCFGDFLSKVCAGLRNPPVERLDDERRVLRTESRGRTVSWLGELLALRFGPTRWGLLDCPSYGVESATADDVVAWSRERFTAGNCVVWCAGPIPEALEIPLGDGPRFDPPSTTPIPELRTPAYSATSGGGIAIGGLVDQADGVLALLHIAEDRLGHRLRTVLASAYEVDAYETHLTQHTRAATITADCGDADASQGLEEMLQTVATLATEGPTEEEIRRCTDTARRRWRHLEPTDFLETMAERHLLGMPHRPLADYVAGLDRITPEAVAALAQQLADTGIVIGPEGAPMPAGDRIALHGSWDLPSLPGEKMGVKGFLGKRHVPTLRIGQEGVSVQDRHDEAGIPFDRCVGCLLLPGEEVQLVADEGTWVVISPGDYADGERIMTELRSALGDRVVVTPECIQYDRLTELARQTLKHAGKGVKHEFRTLANFLEEDERAVQLAEARRGLRSGLLALTGSRLVFCFVDEVVDDIPLGVVRSVEADSGVLKVELRDKQSFRWKSDRSNELKAAIDALLKRPQPATEARSVF